MLRTLFAALMLASVVVVPAPEASAEEVSLLFGVGPRFDIESGDANAVSNADAAAADGDDGGDGNGDDVSNGDDDDEDDGDDGNDDNDMIVSAYRQSALCHAFANSRHEIFASPS